MRIMSGSSGPSGPGSGPDWSGSRPRLDLVHGFFYNLCTAISSCFYVFCCCWLIEDCFVGRRSFHGPPFGSPEPAPPPVLHVGHAHHGALGPFLEQPGPPGPPSLVGYTGEPTPY
ncbi:hypothetical protein OROGR_015562 [Orobanche gracilis]